MTLDHQILSTKEQFMDFFKNYPAGEPVVMVNILKFKEQSVNGEESGRAAYSRYSKNVAPLLEKVGGKVLWSGNVKNTVIGDATDKADMVLIVQYPSSQHFMDMATSEEYKKISHDRENALQYGGLWASTTVNM